MTDFDPEDPFGPLMRELAEELGHIGLHVDAMSMVGTPDPAALIDDDDEEEAVLDPDQIVDQIKSERGHFALAVRMLTKDLAFDKRTLYPEQFAQDMDARVIMPAEHELLREEIERQLAEGVSPDEVEIPDIYKLGVVEEDDDCE